MSETGENCRTAKHLTTPKIVSVCRNEVFLADWQNGVYHTTDGEIDWKLVFKIPDEWRCHQVIKVSSGDQDTFWTIESSPDEVYGYKLRSRLRRYIWDKSTNNASPITWQNFDFEAINTIDRDENDKTINLGPQDIRITYDGERSIYAADYNKNSIHVFSTSGQYQCELLSQKDGLNKPCCLVVDRIRRLLYVAQASGEVKIFTLL